MLSQIDKTQIIRLIQESRAQFNAVFTEVQSEGEPLHDEWRLKDLIAHITLWETLMVNWLRMAASGVPPGADINVALSNVDQLNAQFYTDNKTRSLHAVQTTSDNVFKQLIDQLLALPDDPHDERWSLWRDGEPPWSLIAGNTYEHYQEHTVQVRGWLDDKKE